MLVIENVYLHQKSRHRFEVKILSVSLKFGACNITSQWGRVQNTECYFIFTYTFLIFFFLLVIKKFVFLSILFLFLMKHQIFKTGKTETGIVHKKLSVELYADVVTSPWSNLWFTKAITKLKEIANFKRRVKCRKQWNN